MRSRQSLSLQNREGINWPPWQWLTKTGPEHYGLCASANHPQALRPKSMLRSTTSASLSASAFGFKPAHTFAVFGLTKAITDRNIALDARAKARRRLFKSFDRTEVAQ